ncbi:MAG: DHH family phosphoesterase, partial [Candidatus Thorarchaeota archaeon]
MSTRLLVSTARSILILGHQNADPDAVASMVAMMQYCRHLNPECIVKLACSDMSRISSQMLRMFVGDVVVGESVEDEFDLMIIVDTNSRYQLGPQLENLTLDPSRTIVIDHHDRTPDTSALAHNLVIDEGKSSTCEIVLELLENDGVPLDRATASLLLAGLIFDTRRFLYGGIAAIRNALRLVENGADYDMCLRSLIVRLDRSERIA